MSRLIPIALVAALLLCGFMAAATPQPQPGQTPFLFLTADHVAGLTLYHDQPTNNTSPYQSSLRAYRSLDLYLIGEGLNFSVSVNNQTFNGTTNSTLSTLAIPVNGSSVRVIVYLFTVDPLNVSNVSRAVYNFGSIDIFQEALTIEEAFRPVMLSIEQFLKKEWWSLFQVAILVCAIDLTLFTLFVKLKRGRVSYW